MPLPIRVRKRLPQKGSPAFCKPRKNKLEKPGSLPSVAQVRLTKKPPEYYISPGNICQVSPGCIVWLPVKEHILPGAIIDGRLHEKAFNHPAVILSIPRPLTHNSIVEFAIMTSCGGRTLHQASKLRHRSQLLRVKTAAHPYARVDLNMKKGKGMAREHSYVGLIWYSIQLCTLGFYEHQLGEYCLTDHSLRKLAGRIMN